MAGPWESYASDSATADGPWTQYANQPATLNPNLAAQGRKAEAAREEGRSQADALSGRDPGIDYSTGVGHVPFRAGFSRMTNDAEKANYLNMRVGQGNWGKDSSGAYYINPQGLQRIGITSKKPVSIDEQRTTVADVADFAGDAPAVLGGLGAGMMASGAGALPGMLAAAGGAVTGKALDELVKNQQGLQRKTAGEVGATLLEEGAGAALGEGAGRLLMAGGRFALGPGARRMTPETRALAADAQSQGFAVRPGSVTDAPILARWEGMIRKIFGDLNESQNRRAAEAGMARLQGGGAPVSTEVAGEAVTNAIKKERVLFARLMERRYAQVDDLAGGQPIIPTDPIKQVAQQLFDAMPKTKEGTVVGGKDKFVRELLEMPDAITVAQAQRVRTLLREASESNDILPDIAKHEAKALRKSVDGAFSEGALVKGAPEQAIQALRQADAAYAQGIRQFDKPVIKRITMDASKGSVDPDMVVDYIVRPDRVVRLRQVKQMVPAAEWSKVQASHAEQMLSSLVKDTPDPLKTIFDGQAFRNELNKYGRQVLEEVHGKQWVDAAYSYANALMLAEKRMGASGGIVAANVALHPLQNIPLLAWLRGMAHVMQSPTAFKYLTDGIQAGPGTKTGAAAITRFATQAAANARDETGSATVTLDD